MWRAKYRLPDGRQVKRTIGPVWTERGRPRSGFYTRRTAQDWLARVLEAVSEVVTRRVPFVQGSTEPPVEPPAAVPRRAQLLQ